MKKNNILKRVLVKIIISSILLINSPVFAQDSLFVRLYDKRIEILQSYLDFLFSLWVEGKILDFLQLTLFSVAMLFGICYFFCWILSFFISGLFNPFLSNISKIRKAHDLSNNSLFSIRSEISSINDTLKKLVDCSRDMTSSIEKVNNKEILIDNKVHLDTLEDLNISVQAFLKIHQENLEVQKSIMISLVKIVEESRANPTQNRTELVATYKTSEDGAIKF